MPIYPGTEALPSWLVAKAVRSVLDQLEPGDVADPLPEELGQIEGDKATAVRSLTTRRTNIEDRRRRLLHAHYEGAVPLDLLKEEQAELSTELNQIERQLAAYQADAAAQAAGDGPGTRMTVFLNGCPLRCQYCHNPDTFLMKDGEPVEASELLRRMRRYRGVFRASKGGITLSGGEVLMQPAFAGKLLAGAKKMGIHTCIDTSGFLGANASDEMLDNIDLVLLDVKSGDEETYKKVTGRSLAPTITFGDRLAAKGIEIWARFVLVPDLTDAPENVHNVARIIERRGPGRPGGCRAVTSP